MMHKCIMVKELGKEKRRKIKQQNVY